MKRYPDGIAGEALLPEGRARRTCPTGSRRRRSRPRRARRGDKRMIRYPLVNEEAPLLWMANMGCIDMNAWYSRTDQPDRPDFVLFDLDPTPEAGFAAAAEVAQLVKRRARRDRPARLPEDERLRRHPRARSARPALRLRRPAGSCSRPSRALADSHPDLITTEWSKAKRRGVLIDANQNGPGRTIAFAYSVRPRPGAPVSTPGRLGRATRKLTPEDFTMDVVLDRLIPTAATSRAGARGPPGARPGASQPLSRA